tara:strand:+ start:1393 stop:2262 length:870 start_codon:yes stop_codon:yes gene_type:complete
MFNWHKKEKPLQGLTGLGGGIVSRTLGGGATPITASGGTESTPGDGFKYHVYEYNSPGPFNVTDGAGEVQIMLQGGGGGGQGGGGFGGNPGPSFWPGKGGGGGATGVFTISKLGPGNHTISVGGPGPSAGGVSGGSPGSDGFGGTGGDTTFTPSDSSGVLTAGGGTGSGGGGGNSNTVPGATLTLNRGGGGGQSLPNTPRRPGGAGGDAGGVPESAPLWWRPYISPGAGGTGSNLPFDTGTQTPATAGSNYGGGGGGGRGGFPLPNGFASATGSAAGGQGRAVVRYLAP